jgi:RNA polymerase sigma-70 factor, ECF subfamily
MPVLRDNICCSDKLLASVPKFIVRWTLSPVRRLLAEAWSRRCESVRVEEGRTAFGIEELLTLGSDALTSRSLLVRVAANDQDSWQQLVKLYSPLVVHWCRQAGLPDNERDDVVQDVFASVATGLKSRREGQPGASFRAWMRGITRHKIQDHFRRRPASAEGGTDALVRLREVPQPADLPDLSESDAEIAGLHRRALELVRAQFEDRTWQAFWKVVIEETSPAEVARDLGMTALAVRQAKSRILRRLKLELGEAIV